MNCLKCGRETDEDHVFCESCRETMKKYPVRPGTAVLLPRRDHAPAVKKSRHRVRSVPTPEEQIRRLKRQRTWLSCLVCAFLLIFAAGTFLLVNLHRGENHRPGQNYSAVETTAPSAEN